MQHAMSTRADIDRLLAANPSVRCHIKGGSLDTMPEADLRLFLNDLRRSLGLRVRPLTARDRHPEAGDILRYFRYPMRYIRSYAGDLQCAQVEAGNFDAGTGRIWEIPMGTWKQATYERRVDGGPIEIEVPDEDGL